MAYLLQQLLDVSADRHPNKPAVRARERSLTYAELHARSSQLAHLLRAQGVARGDRVGLFFPKAVESVVAMLGVLKAGAVYVPLDPHAPTRRLGAIAAHEIAWSALDAFPTSAPPDGGVETDLAYILYTSGSTGQPKGVMLTHRNALTFVDWCAATFAITADDRLSNHAPLHFDLSVFDIYNALGAGATVSLVHEELTVFPRRVADFIEQHGITVWYSVPSALVYLLLHADLGARDLDR